MIRCPFYIHCKQERETAEEVLVHIGQDHQSVRGHSYGSKYQGNGSINTLEINMDKKEMIT